MALKITKNIQLSEIIQEEHFKYFILYIFNHLEKMKQKDGQENNYGESIKQKEIRMILELIIIKYKKLNLGKDMGFHSIFNSK